MRGKTKDHMIKKYLISVKTITIDNIDIFTHKYLKYIYLTKSK